MGSDSGELIKEKNTCARGEAIEAERERVEVQAGVGTRAPRGLGCLDFSSKVGSTTREREGGAEREREREREREIMLGSVWTWGELAGGEVRTRSATLCSSRRLLRRSLRLCQAR